MNNEMKIMVTRKIILTDHLSKSIMILTIPRLIILPFFFYLRNKCLSLMLLLAVKQKGVSFENCAESFAQKMKAR